MCHEIREKEIAVLKVLHAGGRCISPRDIFKITLEFSNISTRFVTAGNFVGWRCRRPALWEIAPQELVLRLQNTIQTFMTKLERRGSGNFW
jgi:hypothetical protein